MSQGKRGDVVSPLEVGVYHAWSRCVRRAMLCGADPLTKKDYTYRRDWIVDFEKELAKLFAVEIGFHAELGNHLHLVFRIRPDIVATWSDREVVRRWKTITHLVKSRDGVPVEISDVEITIEAKNRDRVTKLRERLSHPSHFMGALCEFVGRRCNREDECTGAFWEDRYGCRNLLDEASILVCGIYVDLNQIRAGEAQAPETSQHTSAYDRIRGWQARQAEAAAKATSDSGDAGRVNTREMPDDWLCELTLASGPDMSLADGLTSATGRRASDKGLLSITLEKYLELLDASGRILRDKKGSIPEHLTPILDRLKINKNTWADMIQNFHAMFGSVVGSSQNVEAHTRAKKRQRFDGQQRCAEAFG